MAEEQALSGGPEQPDRRTFLKRAGASFVSLAFVTLGVADAVRSPHFPAMAASSGVILPDPTLCIGCLTCEVACSEVHKEAGLSDVPRIRIYYRDDTVVNPKIVESFGNRGKFFQHVCVQCPDAPCVAVCPVEALKPEAKSGARVIDPAICIACGKCEQVCIFPTPDEAKTVGSDRFNQHSRITHDAKRNVFAKCDMCHFRAQGPACVERCPVNVRIRQGVVKSDVLCLDVLGPVTDQNFTRMRVQQTV